MSVCIKPQINTSTLAGVELSQKGVQWLNTQAKNNDVTLEVKKTAPTGQAVTAIGSRPLYNFEIQDSKDGKKLGAGGNQLYAAGWHFDRQTKRTVRPEQYRYQSRDRGTITAFPAKLNRMIAAMPSFISEGIAFFCFGVKKKNLEIYKKFSAHPLDNLP